MSIGCTRCCSWYSAEYLHVMLQYIVGPFRLRWTPDIDCSNQLIHLIYYLGGE